MKNSTPGAIFIPGNVPSSKNGKIKTRWGLISSKATREWEKNTEVDWKLKRADFLRLLEGKEKPYYIAFQFVRKSKHQFDYINPAQTIQDAMVKHCWLFDDNADELVPSFLPYIYDKENPGVYIHVL